MNKIERHKQILVEMHDLYQRKNHDYGDAFREAYKELGAISGVTSKRINDKYDFEIELTDQESQALKWEDDDPTIKYRLETINQKYNAEIVGVEEQLKLF